MMKADLTQVLNYKNTTVVDYFCRNHPELTSLEGQVLFKDLLAWMWLNALRVEKGKKTYLFGPLLVLDELWHTFILHSRDYVDFSIQYFGFYFHHDIEPFGAEHVLEEEELTDFLQDCFTFLGQEWVTRRFETALT